MANAVVGISAAQIIYVPNVRSFSLFPLFGCSLLEQAVQSFNLSLDNIEERGLSSLTNASKVDFRMVPAIRLILTWTNNNVHVALSHTTSARFY